MPILNAPGLDTIAIAPPAVIFDPTQPIPRAPVRLSNWTSAPGQNQRNRRAIILATIRRLLIEEGFDGVTVRRVAECSGHAVQTIYNLVGPRDLAIIEAINEYSQYVNLTATPDPDDPYASAAIIERELKSIQLNPEFCRNVCLIFFSESRSIFYDFRDRQVKSMCNFLTQQQKAGIVRADVDARNLAEQLILYVSALFVEWSDRPFAFEQLQQRLYAGYGSLIAGAINPSCGRVHQTLMSRGAAALG